MGVTWQWNRLRACAFEFTLTYRVEFEVAQKFQLFSFDPCSLFLFDSIRSLHRFCCCCCFGCVACTCIWKLLYHVCRCAGALSMPTRFFNAYLVYWFLFVRRLKLGIYFKWTFNRSNQKWKRNKNKINSKCRGVAENWVRHQIDTPILNESI